ncbi:uncharacterized protein [Primulina eburnea]|uniref:uncharacterized protein n=1 Tax=Primulina eburnea TaxID=1245227 RepID=UPI003C6C4AFE
MFRCLLPWLHAPPHQTSIAFNSPSEFSSRHLPMSTSFRIAVVGDVHDDWNLEEDTKALQVLKPDLVLFTGDFGNENVDIVGSVSKLEFPKAVILGNHDAWNTHTFSAREKDAVQLELECLGDEHVAYRRIDFPNLKTSIVGGRPFSCGGDHLFRKKLLIARYGVRDLADSAKRIYDAALRTPVDNSVIFLAHNGPTGLGTDMDDICGRDWIPGGGDHGDSDLAQAISELKMSTKICIPLVVFGHMHKELAYGNGVRKMLVVGEDDTIYLNGAIVPRVKRIRDKTGNNSESSKLGQTSIPISNAQGTLRAFTVIDIVDGSLMKIVETWVSVIGDRTAIEKEQLLFKQSG